MVHVYGIIYTLLSIVINCYRLLSISMLYSVLWKCYFLSILPLSCNFVTHNSDVLDTYYLKSTEPLHLATTLKIHSPSFPLRHELEIGSKALRLMIHHLTMLDRFIIQLQFWDGSKFTHQQNLHLQWLKLVYFHYTDLLTPSSQRKIRNSVPSIFPHMKQNTGLWGPNLPVLKIKLKRPAFKREHLRCF